MTNGPPCTTCGSTLRWIVERNAWGCDRCRVVHDGLPRANPQGPGTMIGSGPSQLGLPGYGPARGGVIANSSGSGGTLGGQMRSPFAANAQQPAPPAQPPSAPTPYATPPSGPTPYGAPAQPYAAPASGPSGVPQPYGTPPSAPNANPYGTPPSAPNPYGAPGQPFARPGNPPPIAPAAPAYTAPGSNSAPYGATPAPGTTPGYGAPNPAPYGATPVPGSNPALAAPGAFGAPSHQQSSYGTGSNPALAPYPGAHPPSQFGAPPVAPAPVAAQSYIAAPVAPVAAATPRPAPTTTSSGSKKGLVIGGVLLLAGAGVALAIVLTRGGGDPKGMASRDELVTATLAALSNGDTDALLALAGPEDLLARHADCKPSDKPEDDPAKARTAYREALQKLVDDAKGLTAELVEIKGDTKTTLESGKELGRCTLTTAMTTVVVKAKIKVVSAGKPTRTIDTDMTATELAGGWYMTMPPSIRPPADCKGAIAKAMKASRDVLAGMQVTDTGIAKLETKMLERCNADRWTDEVVDCVAKVASDADLYRCVKKLPAQKRDELKKDIDTILEQETKIVATAPGSGSAAGSAAKPGGDPLPPEEPADASALPPACKDLREATDKLKSCRRVPKGTRDRMVKTYETVQQSWDELAAKTAALKTSFERTCGENLSAVNDLLASCK